jgi:hypothetical protein
MQAALEAQQLTTSLQRDVELSAVARERRLQLLQSDDAARAHAAVEERKRFEQAISQQEVRACALLVAHAGAPLYCHCIYCSMHIAVILC